MIRIFELERTGLYHICGAERISRYDFARKIADIFGFDSSLVIPVKSLELNQPAPRPLVTGFYTEKASEELGWKAMDINQGVTLLKQELQAARKN